MAMMSHDFLYERPQTGESIHCTSIASDLTENRDSELKSDFEKLDGSGLVTIASIYIFNRVIHIDWMDLQCMSK